MTIEQIENIFSKMKVPMKAWDATTKKIVSNAVFSIENAGDGYIIYKVMIADKEAYYSCDGEGDYRTNEELLRTI